MAVGLHIRQGCIRHIFPALDLTLYDGTTSLSSSTSLSKEEGDNHQQQNPMYRNRGLCSVPRAYQWMEFNTLALSSTSASGGGGGLPTCRLVLQSRRPRPQQSTEDENEENDNTWVTHGQVTNIDQLVSKAITALVEGNPPTGIGDGSCIVHVVDSGDNMEQDDTDCETTANSIPLPRVGSDIRCLLVQDDETSTSIGTPSTILGTLQVTVVPTAAGSESQYLPEAYVPLFHDDTFRRPAYTEMKRRRKAKQ
jgi:hypothetical protein